MIYDGPLSRLVHHRHLRLKLTVRDQIDNGAKQEGPKRWFYELWDENENNKLLKGPKVQLSLVFNSGRSAPSFFTFIIFFILLPPHIYINIFQIFFSSKIQIQKVPTFFPQI